MVMNADFLPARLRSLSRTDLEIPWRIWEVQRPRTHVPFPHRPCARGSPDPPADVPPLWTCPPDPRAAPSIPSRHLRRFLKVRPARLPPPVYQLPSLQEQPGQTARAA